MQWLFELLLVAFTAYALGLSLYPVFISLYERFNLLDKRDRRKVHIKEVPTMGGVPIFIAFIVATFIWLSYIELAQNRYLMGSLVFMLFVGLRDDFINLKPIIKLFSQMVPAFVIFYFTDVKITSLYGFFSEAEFPLLISFVVTVITMVVISNSFNLIDGLDGLAGSITLVVFSSLGIWFSLNEQNIYGMLLFAMAGSVAAFLFFNWQPAKIFMGDTGALILGFLASVSIIKFINVNHGLAETGFLRFDGSVATALALLIIPLGDTLRVFFLRLIKGKSPFAADKNHIHHVLMRLGLTHRKVALLLAAVNMIFISLAVVFRNVNDIILVPALLVLGVFFSLLLEYLTIKRLLGRGKKDNRSLMEIIKSSRKAS